MLHEFIAFIQLLRGYLVLWRKNQQQPVTNIQARNIEKLRG